LIRRILSILILTGIIVVLAIAGYVYFKQTGTFPAAQAKLEVLTGTAAIKSVGASQVDLNNGQEHAVKIGDVIKTNGRASLTFAGVQVDLMPDAELEVKLANATGNEGQTELILKTGQVFQQVSGYRSPKSYYAISTAGVSMHTQGGEVLMHTLAGGITQVASASGSAAVTINGKTVALTAGQGLTIKPGEALPDPVPWSQVSVRTFRPDGSPIALPVSLTNDQSKEEFDFISNTAYLVPEATYTLKLQVLSTYQISDLKLSAAGVNDFPITLSEAIFAIVDADGKPQPYTALAIKGDAQTDALPDTPVLLAPGKSSLIMARTEQPAAVQPVEVEVEPGQRITFPIRNDLFGGGKIKVDLSDAGEGSVTPTGVMVYPPDNENGDPIASFKTDSVSPLVPAGDYVVSVRTQLAGRYKVTVPQNQTVSLSVPVGYLDITYTEAQGRPVNRNVFIYIASVAEMNRLGLTIDQMRRTPYGLGIPLGTTNKILLPAGSYNILVDDRKDVGLENIEVKAGQTTPVQLVAPAP
jgi:hypothetical protein